ncbi:hypothetical protein [Pseudoalteromonas sp. 10-33]|uniref:hypothetical protein n=1 Tax=Pseudoalteromonas sp. 10-33 TaxID=1761890 RepID=UPI000A6A59EE|nr:hypothetical protein [Pseudoalteromonas sp. 10-33]
MLKGNYKAWGISIGLHIVVIYLVSRQTLEIAQPYAGKVIKAYVMVDLTTLPSHTKSKQPNAPFSENDTELDASELTLKPLKERYFKNDQQLKLALPEDAIEASESIAISTGKKKPNVNNANVNNVKDEVDLKTQQQLFKKIDPYAPITPFSISSNAIVSFDFPQIATLPKSKNHQQITVPIEHSSDFKSAVLWQSADGSQRMEMHKGMCYKIDFNGVMGKVGLPTGSPRPCKDNVRILYNKIMDKWNAKKPIR